MLVVDKPLGWTSTDVVRKSSSCSPQFAEPEGQPCRHARPLRHGRTRRMPLAKPQIGGSRCRPGGMAEMKLSATTPSFDMEHPEDAAYPLGTHPLRAERWNRPSPAALTGERLQIPPLYSARKSTGSVPTNTPAKAKKEVSGLPQSASAWAARMRPARQDTGGVQGFVRFKLAREMTEALGSQGLPHLAPPDMRGSRFYIWGGSHGRINILK